MNKSTLEDTLLFPRTSTDYFSYNEGRTQVAEKSKPEPDWYRFVANEKTITVEQHVGAAAERYLIDFVKEPPTRHTR